MLDTLRALQLMEQGYTTRRVAKEMGLELANFFHKMNNKNGMNTSKVESLMIKGVTAQQIYDEHYAPAKPEPESKEPDKSQSAIQVTHELLRGILEELVIIRHFITASGEPIDVPERKPKKPKRKGTHGKLRNPDWTAEEDDYLLTAHGVDNKNFAAEVHKEYPNRSIPAINSRYYALLRKKRESND